MSDSAVEVYLGWLGLQVRVDNGKSYEHLLSLLQQKEFVWLVPNDDNRIADGLELRQEFAHETRGIRVTGECGVLEVLIGISRRLEFMAGGDAAGWAWQLICNLELHKVADPIGPRKALKVDEILEALVWRNYDPDGTGGFFPLAWPEEDQTKVEIWYQMAKYVEEIHPEY
jgi:hypothetical protein